MAASALIRFDTQAPVVTLGAAFMNQAGEIVVPFDVDEAATIDVTLLEPVEATLQIDEERFIISAFPEGTTEVSIRVSATDDVLNTSLVDLESILRVADLIYPLSLEIDDVPTTLEIDMALEYLEIDSVPNRTLSIDSVQDSDLTIEDENTTLSIEGDDKTLSIEAVDDRGMSITPIDNKRLDIDDNETTLSIDDYEEDA
jgi:hypothetical protein